MRLLICVLSLQLLILGDHYRGSSALRGRVDVVSDSNGNYTFVVAVLNKKSGKVVCTGSLITKRHVLTSKHCLLAYSKADLEVVAGNYNRKKGTKYDISNSVSFYQWAREKNLSHLHQGADDVDVLTLSEPVTDSVKVARLSDKPARQFDGAVAEILGWGETDDGQEELLRKGIVGLLDPNECKLHVKAHNGEKSYKLKDDHICSSSPYMERLSKGDEGGPLLVKGEVIGIALHPIIPDGNDHEYEPNLHLSVYRYQNFTDSFNDNVKDENDEDEEDDEDCVL